MRFPTLRRRSCPRARAQSPRRYSVQPRALRLEDRCVPAVITEFPLNTALPAPQGIAAGPDGALWYTDTGANKIGRVSTTGGVTEFSLPTPLSDPKGIVAGPDGNLWFTEFGVDRIARITTGGVITEFQLTLNSGPSDIAVGSDGALWFTESASDQIGRITVTGTVTEFIVPGGGSTPFGIAAGPDGQLWFTEFDSNEIGAITTAGVVTEFTSGAATQPTGITTGPDGNLWFGSNAGSFIGRITPTGTLVVFTGFGVAGTTVPDITAGPDGALWFTEGAVSRVGRIATNGAITDEFTSNFGTTAITPGPDDNLWFTEVNGPAIGQVTTAGVVTEFNLRASGDLSDIVFGPDLNRWFTEAGADKVAKMSIATNLFVEYYLSPTSDPRGITVGPDSKIWFTEFGTDRIGRIDPATGAITEFSMGITVGAAPRDIARGTGGLWFTESGADQIGLITTAGVVTEFTVPGLGSIPFGIAQGADGAMWFTEFGSDQIGRITAAGVVTEFTVPGAGSGPFDITLGPDKALWFTENTSSEIGRITTAGIITNEFPTLTPSAGPSGITSFADGALWFTETAAAQIGRITIAGVRTEFSTGLTPGSGPLGIAPGGLPGASLAFTESIGNQIGTIDVSADLSITKTDGVTSVSRGNTVTYTIVVANAGQDANEVVNVLDTFPSVLTNVVWTAVFAGGAGGRANGANTISEIVSLPVGGSVTYTVTAIVGPAASGTVTNTARVTTFAVIDPNGANNTATDTDTVIDNTVHLFATGPGFGGGPHVKVFNSSGTLVREFLAYDANFRGGVTVATGLVDSDNVEDIITGAGPSGGPHVKVFSGATGALIFSFFAYAADFRGGVNVGAGDTDRDGHADIITGPGQTGGPQVKVFSGANGAQLVNLIAYDISFLGGVFVAGGDVNGDGFADIITGAGPGGGPHVKVFPSFMGAFGVTGASFFPYDPNFHGGVTVAAGDVNADGGADIITAPGFGGGPVVRIFDGPAALGGILRPLSNLFAYDLSFRGGVFVAADDLNGDGRADIITGAGPSGGPHVKVFNGANLALLQSFFAYDPAFNGGVYVG
jgi:uncharacterized repeat protein (TIGR01451 family)